MADPLINTKKLEELRDKNPFISNTDLVYKLLLDDIVDHKIAPGQKLNQEQIADDLEMSRTPVRDALSRLENGGFLSKQGHGYIVYEMKIGDYMALLDLRIAIEQLATKLACSRITVTEIKNIERNLVQTGKLIEDGYKYAWNESNIITDKEKGAHIIHKLGEKDQEFHQMIVHSSHNKYIIQSYSDLMPKIHFFRFTAMDVNACLNMSDRHKLIYQAITLRDEDLAQQRMATHLQLTISRAMRY